MYLVNMKHIILPMYDRYRYWYIVIGYPFSTSTRLTWSPLLIPAIHPAPQLFEFPLFFGWTIKLTTIRNYKVLSYDEKAPLLHA
jgi:hypothetical protein